MTDRHGVSDDDVADGDAAPARSAGALRFGVMCSGLTFRSWQADVIHQLLAVDGVEPAMLIVDARPPAERGLAARVRRLATSPTAVWDLYNNGWVARRSAALRPVRMEDELGALPRLDVVVRKDGWSERFEPDDIDEVRRHDLDFILRFAFGIIRGEILEAARFGVWSFHHDDEEAYRGSPPAFWEIVEGAPVTGAVLQRLTDRLDGGHILDKGWFRTTRHSYVRNTDTVHIGGADWPARQARALLEGTSDGSGVTSTSQAPIFKKPANGVATRFLVRQGARFVRNHIEGITTADHWEIGVIRSPIARLLDPEFEPRVEWLDLGEPGKFYAADPFLVEEDGRRVVLYERFDARTRRGELWEAELGVTGTSRPVRADITAHASYPFVLESAGRTLVVPQLTQPGVEIFERRDGRLWPHLSLLPGISVLDPTLFEHEGRWWLFGTRPGRSSLTKLWAWWADALDGEWRPHTMNPIKTDVRSARPAGTPFVHEGALFRPAQDCSTGYGSGVALCEILRLDPDHFAERVARVITPSPHWPFRRGMHTLADGGDVTLLDARRLVIDRHEAVAELRGRLDRVGPRR